jgi:uncharacterized membrane protein YdfJ with MMPL/SSD domain
VRLRLLFASTIVAAAVAATLPVRTDFARLLPADAPSVVALHELTRRKPSTAVVEIGIASPDPLAAERFARELSQSLRKSVPKDLMRELEDDDAPLRKFIWDSRFLRVSEADLRRAIARANPLFVDLGEGNEGELEAHVEKLRRATVGRSPGYVGEGGQLRMLLARAPFGDSEPEKGQRLLGAIRSAVGQLHPEQARVEVGYAGDVVTAALEHDLVLRDVAVTALLCLLLVLGILRVAFRSTRAVFALAASLAVGCAWTFAFARLCIGELNSATAFLGPMVAGNGINAGIILLARYLEERRGSSAHAEALRIAVRSTALPTLLASACAAGADFSLLFTRFRAFSEFGAIAGAGMGLCWLATYLTLPPLLSWLDARRPLAPPISRERRASAPPLFAAALAVAAGLVLAFFGARALPLQYQDDLRSLRSRSLPQSAAGLWSRRLDAAFGRDQAGGFFIGAQSEEDVRAVIDALASVQGERFPSDRVFGKIDALPLLLPGTRTEQERRIALLRRLGVSGLRPMDAEDLPAALREAFTESNGRVGLLLVIHPGPAFDGWSVRGIRRAVEELRFLPLPPGVAARLSISGPEVIFADMMREVEQALPRAAALALAVAAALLLLLFGFRIEGASALFATSAGVLGMLAALHALGLRLDFLSALAVPITIGIAGDYPLNMLGRLRQDLRSSEPWRGLFRTGSAVLLCSLTTAIGYAVLLASDTGAIRSFGLAALTGEASCLFAALVLAPAAERLAQALRR